MPNKQQNI